MKILPIILSGGSGTRLWPVSRSGYPKQLQELYGTGTLLQQTAQRLPAKDDILSPVVVCSAEQRFIVAEQLREVGVTPSLIALEPCGRNTAPALAVAALSVAKPEETVLAALPADHFINDPQAFHAAIISAAAAAEQGRLMTLGIKPTSPHTGYGYIECGKPLAGVAGNEVISFKEKPDAETAARYLEGGRHLWNAGVFIFRADVYLRELEKLQPEIIARCREAMRKSKRDLDFLRLDPDAFAQSPSLSVDYALMEHVSNAGVLPVSFAWSDLGSWQSLWDLGPRDENGNVLKGDVIEHDAHNCYVRAENRLVTILGVNNLAVIETADALLIADRHRTEEIREIVTRLQKSGRSEENTHKRVWRPWGYYEQLNAGERFQVKLIMVKPNGRLSLQMHHHRAEHWVVVSGTAKVTRGNEVSVIGPNETAYVPIGMMHRLENPGKMPVFMIEVQSGDYLGEDDIVRFEDDYKRVS